MRVLVEELFVTLGAARSVSPRLPLGRANAGASAGDDRSTWRHVDGIGNLRRRSTIRQETPWSISASTLGRSKTRRRIRPVEPRPRQVVFLGDHCQPSRRAAKMFALHP
jgi:hypothetical protein